MKPTQNIMEQYMQLPNLPLMNKKAFRLNETVRTIPYSAGFPWIIVYLNTVGSVDPNILTHLLPMHPFSKLWKHQKTVRFSDVLRG